MDHLPLVSAVCLTYDLKRRLQVVNEAVESFLRQDYPNKQLIIVIDSPGLRIVPNLPDSVKIVYSRPCPTLGDKYNLGVEHSDGELICSWDDDDISLPHRMSLGVSKFQQLPGLAYYNPKAYWFDCPPIFQHEVKTGYAHNASMYSREAWLKVGKYPSQNNGADATMDARLQTLPTLIGSGNIRESAYIYRWGDGLVHGSYGPEIYPVAQKMRQEGLFEITPIWRQNYVDLVKYKIESLTLSIAS